MSIMEWEKLERVFAVEALSNGSYRQYHWNLTIVKFLSQNKSLNRALRVRGTVLLRPIIFTAICFIVVKRPSCWYNAQISLILHVTTTWENTSSVKTAFNFAHSHPVKQVHLYHSETSHHFSAPNLQKQFALPHPVQTRVQFLALPLSVQTRDKFQNIRI